MYPRSLYKKGDLSIEYSSSLGIYALEIGNEIISLHPSCFNNVYDSEKPLENLIKELSERKPFILNLLNSKGLNLDDLKNAFGEIRNLNSRVHNSLERAL